MKISIEYLKNFIDIPSDYNRILQDLTLNGFEVEAIEYPYKDIDDKILIVDINSISPHPVNPELSVVNIYDGKDNHTVVCGAKNVKCGLKGVWAPPGSRVKGYEIKEKDFKGIRSSGMLLSLEELGLQESSEGIWLFQAKEPAGTRLTEILKKDTLVIDINITPNRGDALSYLGIARELSAYYNLNLTLPPATIKTEGIKPGLEISLLNQEGCPLYQGTFAEGIVVKESDIHLQKLLIESGLRPICNVVDLSNFVMLETGHPNHTFDFSLIKGSKIIVRNALKGEKIKLLNGDEITLSEKDLLICDESSPLALAGIMGGEYSSINNNTTTILLECAIFNPLTIRYTTSIYNINTDSSYRFARGVDPSTVDYASRRFMYLLKEEIPQITVYDPVVVRSELLNKRSFINFRYSKADRLLGRRIDREFIKQTISKLGINIEKETPDSIEVAIPSHRYDLSTEEDIIEEIARIYGYNNFGFSLPHTEISETDLNIREKFTRKITYFLSNRGLNEVINYSFISDEINSIFSRAEAVLIKNPISQDMASMRKSLLPSLIQTALLNFNRQNRDIRIFEKGKVFIKEGGDIKESESLGILLSGRTNERIWANEIREYDFFDIKGIVEGLIDTLNIKDVQFKSLEIPEYMHPGKSARIYIDSEYSGILGELHPAILKKFDSKQKIYVAEINTEILFEKYRRHKKGFTKYSPYPAVDRDIALVVQKEIPSRDIIEEIRRMEIPIVESISIFDLYEGEAIEEGKKSIGISIKYRSNEKTLTDEEVENIHSKIVDNLIKKFYARLR